MEKNSFEKLTLLLPGLKRNVLLKDYTTFKIGGRAQYFFEAKEKEDFIRAISITKKTKLPFLVLGRGSNLLIADEGFDGLVIKLSNSEYKILNTKIIVQAGAMLGKIINVSLRAGLTGLEWAIGIPGTVGGAINGNAGAFGKSMKNIVKEVKVFDFQKEKIKSFENKDCKFSYRNSIFKNNSNLIILSAYLRLKKEKKSRIEKKIKKYSNYKKETQPLDFPSAGSIFKNPELKIKNLKLLIKEFPELKKINKKGIIPAAYLIEKCGLKGKKIGDVKISEKHANFILNLGKGKARDVKKLIKLIKNKVKKIFGVVLKEEICIITKKF